MRNKLLRGLAHLVFPVKRAQYRHLKKFADKISNKKILEIGSGRYNISSFFNQSNEFITSDIKAECGMRNIDVSEMNIGNEFDVVIMLNVLEHVFAYQKAIDNVHTALKQNGVLFLGVPAFYPLHDEPYDYWRFTEHSLKHILRSFTKVDIKVDGIQAFPYNYTVICTKKEVLSSCEGLP